MNKKEHFYLLWLLGAITFITLAPFVFTGFATGDDIEYYLVYHRGDLWANAFNYAKHNGRFYFTFMMPVFYQWLPYSLGGYWLPKLISLIFIAINYLVFAFIIKEIFNSRWLAYMVYLLGMIFISIAGVNNPIVSYPIYFSLSFTLILFAIYCALLFNRTSTPKYRWLSLACFTTGLLFYETYLIYLPIIVFVITAKPLTTKEKAISIRIKEALSLISPFLIVSVVYLACYLAWRMVYSTYNYPGSMVASDLKVGDMFQTIRSITQGAYPLFFYFSGHKLFIENSYILGNHINGIPFLLYHAKAEWWFKAAIVGALFFYMLTHSNTVTISKKKLLVVVLVAVTFVYLPQLLLATTPKYIELVQCCGYNNYLTTYFSNFPVCFLAALVLMLPISWITHLRLRRAYIGVAALVVALSSIINDYVNAHAANDLKNTWHTFQAVEKFIETDAFKDIPDESVIYCPQLYKSSSEISYMFIQNFKWTDFVFQKTGKHVYFAKEVREFIDNPNVKRYYYLNYGRNRKTEDQFFALSFFMPKPDGDEVGPVISDTGVLYYYSTARSFAVHLETTAFTPDSTVKINGVTYPQNGLHQEYLLTYAEDNGFFKPIYIEAQGIDIKNVVILNNSNSLGIPVRID